MKKTPKTQQKTNQLKFDFCMLSTCLKPSNSPVSQAKIIHFNPRKEIYTKILERR